VPGLLINLDKMKASDWAKLLRDIDSVVAVVIALKTHYSKVDIANIIKRKPKLLLSSQQRVDEDAQKVCGTAGSASLVCCFLWHMLAACCAASILQTGFSTTQQRCRHLRAHTCKEAAQQPLHPLQPLLPEPRTSAAAVFFPNSQTQTRSSPSSAARFKTSTPSSTQCQTS
jgi:hypothetical protein